MTRLDPVDEKKSPEFATVLAELTQSRGKASNALRSMGHAPEGLRRLAAVGDYARYHSSLSARIREIVIVVTGRESAYAMGHHGPLAMQAGVTQDEISALCKGTVPVSFQGVDAAVARYVLEFTSKNSVSDAGFEALKALMTPREITDISITSAYYAAFAMIATAMGVQSDSEDYVKAELDWQHRKDQS
jgi:4-carboxymuconolactone decarboxylase